MEGLTKEQALLMLAALAGPYRVPAGSVRNKKNIGTRGEILSRNHSRSPLFVRISVADDPASIGNFLFSTQNANGIPTAASQVVLLAGHTAAVDVAGSMRYYDAILMPGEDLLGSCIDATIDLKVTEVSVV